ncbi:MAG: hypothetical protein ACD_30C00052G0014 [uncultured bacterium]|uniref:Putative pterin-4-alpha-carbinolamine dehydratase n=3 Tax=Candidatus Daviesiibacteriota TaxID=1752718 RepID=A0A1F5K3R0_9BACT|nr:MAG: hypothetical protein ACD_30C00052G0014 [uncultured bacterium]KKQ14795.1 MAG: hypothetical protein US28_C0029G0020 [Candidatus Daviesbacteria bacterium GW2011_GWA1_36_8]OGE16431.1 MAG: hypothetical protein A2858_01690 [Candidatus Daviesbacteria bacterium RIFCSPHIGHO2_01_FULL_36_37]OGE35321.1 MAG: hypothetical protein A3E66_00505 [Candidatus Daviesbacteria bacterium RIFCSPHIGHO2_12_FULL_37_16]
MEDLTKKKCVPCDTGEGKLEQNKVKEYLKAVHEWFLIGDTIVREYKFKDFKEAMSFINRVADLAEEEGHHPDIFVSYNKVKLTLMTHAAGGLTENDFIMAAKINNF